MPNQYVRKVRAIRPDDNAVICGQFFSSELPPPAWRVLPGWLLSPDRSRPPVEPPWRIEEEINGQWVTVASSDDRPEEAVWLIWPESAAAEWIE